MLRPLGRSLREWAAAHNPLFLHGSFQIVLRYLPMPLKTFWHVGASGLFVTLPCFSEFRALWSQNQRQIQNPNGLLLLGCCKRPAQRLHPVQCLSVPVWAVPFFDLPL